MHEHWDGWIAHANQSSYNRLERKILGKISMIIVNATGDDVKRQEIDRNPL